jgi:hypothetical protein
VAHKIWSVAKKLRLQPPSLPWYLTRPVRNLVMAGLLQGYQGV